MNSQRSSIGQCAVTAVIAAALAALFILSSPEASAALTEVSLDTNTTGNSATVVGTIEPCNTVGVGATVEVDIVIQDVPSLAGFEADVQYNGSLVHVTGEDSAFLLTQPPVPSPILIDWSDPVPDTDGTYNVLVSTTGGGIGDGVVVRLTFTGASAGESTLDLTNVKMKDAANLPVQPADAGGFFTGPINDARIVVGGACDTDSDGDGVSDSTDHCPAWSNPAQELPPWSIPDGDSDCDGFPDDVATGGRGDEVFIGTDPLSRCPADVTDSAWPPDTNNSGTTSLADVILFGTWFNQTGPNPPNALYNPRFDLNASTSVTLSDVIGMGPFFNKSCSQ